MIILGKREWMEAAHEEELGVMRDFTRQHGQKLVPLEILEAFFNNPSFTMIFSPMMLELIEYGRKLMRQSHKGEREVFSSNLHTPLSEIVEFENSRMEPFCRALCRWMTRLIPPYESYNFGKDHRELDSIEKMFQTFRNKKDLVLCTLVHWRYLWNNEVSGVGDRALELFRWLACIHLDMVCVSNPPSALSCVASVAIVVDLYPKPVAQIFRDAVIQCLDHSHPPALLRSIFPLAHKEDFDDTKYVDDPVRDLLILSLADEKKVFEKRVQAMVRTDIASRSQVFCAGSTIFNPIERRFIYAQQDQHPWHRRLIRDIVFHLMRRTFMQLGMKREFAQVLESGIDLSILFANREDAEIYCFFVIWFCEFQKSPLPKKEKKLTRAEMEEEEFMEAFPQICLGSFEDFATKLQKRLVSIGALSKCTSNQLVHLALGALNFPNSLELTRAYQDEIKDDMNKLQNMTKICKRFVPEDSVSEILSHAMEEWRNWRMVDLSFLFGEIYEVPPGSQPPPGPLPEILVRSLKWMIFVMNSPLFGHCWENCKSPSRIPKIADVRRDWEEIFLSIANQTISFPRLEVFIKFLKVPSEFELFYSSTAGYLKGDQLSWDIRTVDKKALASMKRDLLKFAHLQGVLENIERIEGCLPFFKNWIKDIDSVGVLQSHVEDFKVIIEENKWEDQKMSDYPKFAQACEIIHPSLLQLHPALFQKILESLDLFEWLRTQPDDQDFQRGIEMAMGRSEMECPSELWLEEGGQSGRVNEQILSMLQSVRSYLHSFIYREKLIYGTADEFVTKFLAHLMTLKMDLLDKMDTCNEYRLPLIELLSGGTDSAAPDRLLRMLQSSSEAVWSLDSKLVKKGVSSDDVAELLSFLRLKYAIPSKKETIRRHLTVNEVEDFQSTVVLSRTDQRAEDTRSKINNFVESFGWVKQYATYLLNLHSFGHFDYDTFQEAIPLATDAGNIRAKALEAKQLLSNWEKIVSATRMKYPAMNHYGMKIIWELAKLLRKRVQSGGFSHGGGLAQQMIYLINPIAAVDPELVSNVERDLVASWSKLTRDSGSGAKQPEESKQGGGEGDEEDWDMRTALAGEHAEAESSDPSSFQERKMSLHEILDCCGKVVEGVFGKIVPLRRSVELPEENYSLTLHRKDIRLICARSYESVFPEVLSIFMQCNTLPERRTLMLCREDSTWEDVLLMLLRWQQSTNLKEDRLFCLANADILPNEVQTKCVSYINEASETAQVPLLLVCGPSKSVYVVSQFVNRRMPSYPLPRSVMQELVDRSYHGHVRTFMSESAGAGKSFQIRKGYDDGEKYMHIPTTSIPQFISLLDFSLKKKASSAYDPLLHIDIYETVGRDLNSYLFELIFFSGHCNFSTGVIFCFHPTTTYLSIELPTGTLSKHITIARCCPVTQCHAEGSLFAPNKKDLLKGMGRGAFYGRRYDGTALRKVEEGIRHANAFDRLQYVCTALDILRRNHGRFPYIFETNVVETAGLQESIAESLRLSASEDMSVEIAEDEIPGHLCFDLLVRASQLPADRVSLWCLWNFVNMVYWQVRDMHYPDSPLNGVCMPADEKKREGKEVNKKESDEAKRLVKGEILAFILRTAREFATRQSNETPMNEIIGMEVSGFIRNDFNGTWAKQLYEHDGEPVFSTGGFRNVTFYLYYRALEKSWVIDDIIAKDGPSFSHSTTGDVNSVWKTCASWQTDRNIKASKTRNSKGYQGEAIEVKGFPSDSKENGTYVRLPPYDDICGRPHYMKQKNGVRRHLFFSSRENMWQICPICTDDEGAFGIATSLTGCWSMMPEDSVEKNTKFKFVTYGDKHGVKENPIAQDHFLPEFMLEEDEVEQLMAKKDEDFKEFLALEKLFEKTKRWADSNHECLLFSNKNHIVSFMSMDPKVMRKNMHPNLLEFLEQNRINVGESLNELSSRHHEILGALTEVYRSADESKNLMEGHYCLTGDNLLKMLAIFIRLRVGIPVILMGECGCGKTALLKYLCAWLGVELIVLDVHGGTTPEDIVGIFGVAEKKRVKAYEETGKKSNVYVFLDEVNACNHMGLICEVITKRSLHGVPLHDGIHILAALNPYRRRPPQEETFGLVYKHKKGGIAPMIQDEMSTLVYRVTPIPASLRDFVFDFGALELKQERMYVRSMILDFLELPSLEGLEHKEQVRLTAQREKDYNLITDLVVEAQTFVRNREGDPSAVSLRDVRRFLFFCNFFIQMKKPFSDSILVNAVVVSLALVYYYRLSREEHRKNFWVRICDTENDLNRLANGTSFKMPQKVSENHRKYSSYFASLLKKTQSRFCEQLEVEEGIALNNALTENLFVTIVCILNRVPVFLVGKPGTSKTLTLQIIASNLQGQQSPNAFWRRYPSVYVFPYQCSPMSDSSSIQHQFHMAVRYQEHANNTITVLLLDEVGLAEHSPDMPLKCLHGMLVNPPIAIVGLSNWVLDPAKMNRAVLVQRPEPDSNDISSTGESILGLPPKVQAPLVDVLKKISRAYYYVYTHQKGRDFIGMRDYYSLIKYLRSYLPKTLAELKKIQVPKDEIILAICRNFSGRADILRDVLLVMCEELYGGGSARLQPGNAVPISEELTIRDVEAMFDFKCPPLSNLIRKNLNSHAARHLMLLTKNSAALSLLFSCGLVHRDKTKVIIGSEFVEDDTELYLVQQMNEVKLAMATGKVIVLMNADNMYEALYDVLNQRYLIKKDNMTGKVQKLLRLAIGSRSSLCPVEEGFRIIVIAEQEYAYRELDLPLLNRFEKQIFSPTQVLGKGMRQVSEAVYQWVDAILSETTLSSYQQVFCGYHEGTVPSAVFHIFIRASRKFGKGANPAELQDKVELEVKKCLKRIACPAAVALSKSLQSIDEPSCHPDFTTTVDQIFKHEANGLVASLVMTYSPVSDLDDTMIESLKAKITVIRLDEVKSERSFITLLDHFLEKAGTAEKELLIIQFDPIMCSALQVNHSKFLCTQALLHHKSRKGFAHPIGVLFLVHMPPGVRDRARNFVLDYEEPWVCMFLDDLKGAKLQYGVELPTLLHSPFLKLFDYGLANFEETVASQLPAAICRARLPAPLEPAPLAFLEEEVQKVTNFESEMSFSVRMQTLKTSLENPTFRSIFLGAVQSILARQGGEASEKGLLLHTSLAIGDMSCGTLIQSLTRTIGELVLQAMIYVLLYLEKNFNFGTIKQNQELWLELAENKNIFNTGTLPSTSPLGGKTIVRELQMKTAANTGKTGYFISCFPFSFAIFALLKGDETKKAIEGVAAAGKIGVERFNHEVEYMEKIFASFFGEKVVKLLAEGKTDNGKKLDYLHDFVCMCAPPVNGLIFEEISFIHKAVLLCFHPDALKSPAAIHASFAQNEIRIQIIEQIIATLPPGSSARQETLVKMHSVMSSDPSDRMRLLLEVVFDGAVSFIWEKAENLPFIKMPEGEHVPSTEHSCNLPTFISSLHADITDLINDWNQTSKTEEGKLSLKSRWSSLLLLKIFLEGLLQGGSKWGVGSPGQTLLQLLKASNVHSASFYDSFCLSLGDFYSQFCCCTDCGNIIGHFKDEHRKPENLCLSCRSVYTRRTTGTVQSAGPGYSGKLTLPEAFWNDFLATPAERDNTFDSKSKPKPSAPQPSSTPAGPSSISSPSQSSAPVEEEEEQQGFFGRVFSLFRRKDKKQKKEKPPARRKKPVPGLSHTTGISSAGSSSSSKKKEKEKEKKKSPEEFFVDPEALQRSKLGSRRFIENFLVRYTEEILFPIGISSKEFSEVEKKLIYHLSNLTNSQSFRLPITDEQLTDDQDLLLFFDPESSTRVALMNVLLRSERSLNRDLSEKEEASILYRMSTSLGKRLYLAGVLNEFEEKLGALGEDPASLEKLINYASAEDFEVALNWEGLDQDFDQQDEHTKRSRLDSLARVQVVLRRYGRFIGSDSFPTDDLLAHPMYKTFSAYFNKALSPDQAELFRVYVLKTIKEMAGFDCILGFLLVHDKKLCEWVRYDQGALEIVVEDCPVGPLVAKADRDSNLRDLELLVKECIQSDILDDKKVASILNMKHLEKVLIPALYHQVTTLAMVERKNSDRFLKRVNDLGKSLSDGLKGKRSFATLSVLLPAAVNITLLLSFSALDSPHVPRGIVATSTEPGQDLGNKAKILLQVQLRLFMGACVNPSSWLSCLMTEPGKFTERYLPASKFELPLQGLRWFAFLFFHLFSLLSLFLSFSLSLFLFLSFSSFRNSFFFLGMSVQMVIRTVLESVVCLCKGVSVLLVVLTLEVQIIEALLE